MLEIIIGTNKFVLDDAEVKAIEWDVYDIQQWIENAFRSKAQQCMNSLVMQYTDKNPDKMTIEDKKALILTLDIKSAKDRQVIING
jgi:hypothetical protein